MNTREAARYEKHERRRSCQAERSLENRGKKERTSSVEEDSDSGASPQSGSDNAGEVALRETQEERDKYCSINRTRIWSGGLRDSYGSGVDKMIFKHSKSSRS
eukprot:CAMPEP_0184746330 /NCGR_PEP_ID=MMETSP0315-20130426/8872_1 /TAXON_ID=101924 /ORGANISM="Rhodosorus marinus, Strain UTEX LB 2760" /LENGTH=102 /DNA_ID=CAMNT_0027218835 /DNA_START=175 /DNA_END=482 /DNA_ORIENTATION=-